MPSQKSRTILPKRIFVIMLELVLKLDMVLMMMTTKTIGRDRQSYGRIHAIDVGDIFEILMTDLIIFSPKSP